MVQTVDANLTPSSRRSRALSGIGLASGLELTRFGPEFILWENLCPAVIVVCGVVNQAEFKPDRQRVAHAQ
jgi:hypothetical protein